MPVVLRTNAKSDGSINAAFTRIHEAKWPDDRTRVLTALQSYAPWGRRPACVPSTQYPMYTANCKKSWAINKPWKSVSWPFFTGFGQFTLICFLLSCRRRNKSENSDFWRLKRSPEVSTNSFSFLFFFDGKKDSATVQSIVYVSLIRCHAI